MPRRRVASFLRIGLPFVFLATLWLSCREIRDPSQPPAPQTFTGMASAAPIAAGTVSVYALGADGTRGTLLGTAMTDADGNFSVTIAPQSGPIEISVSGGSYMEEATGSTESVGTRELRLWLPSGLTGGSVGITPLTEIAATRAAALQAIGGTLAPHIQAANSAVAGAAGLQDITIAPADPTKTITTPSSEIAKYALVLAGFSQYASDNSLADSFTVTESLAADFRNDGVFDGRDNLSPLDFEGTSTPMPTTLWGNDLQASMTTFANSTAGSSVGFSASAVPTLNPNPSSLTCTSGLTACGGICFDLTSDVSHCGACGAVCSLSHATPSCVSSACAVNSCNSGFGNCDGSAANGCETDITSSTAHCGACGNACPSVTNAVSSCSSGSCGFSCSAGFGNCDSNAANGCEVNLNTNASSCGSCGNVCPTVSNSAPTCSGGSCGISCNAGFGNCNALTADGCEAALNTTSNCGACGNACPTVTNAFSSCSSGSCGFTCNAGFGNCDSNAANGCESDFNTSPSSCGSCGNVCPSVTNASPICSTGSCGFVCNAGFGDCNALSADGCEAALNSTTNCGACGNTCGVGQSCIAGSCQ